VQGQYKGKEDVRGRRGGWQFGGTFLPDSLGAIGKRCIRRRGFLKKGFGLEQKAGWRPSGLGQGLSSRMSRADLP